MIIETCPECGSPLITEVILTKPPIPVKRCSICGWRWEGARESIEYKKFEVKDND